MHILRLNLKITIKNILKQLWYLNCLDTLSPFSEKLPSKIYRSGENMGNLNDQQGKGSCQHIFFLNYVFNIMEGREAANFV